MRKNVVETAALAATLLVAGLSWGQQPARTAPTPTAPATTAPATVVPAMKAPPAKSKLEEMIEKALHDNPDLRLAEAKLAEAEAELNKARLLVVQKVAAQYQAVEAQKAAVEGAAAELEETKTAYKAATISQSVVRTAEQKLIDAKAKLASLEAELPYLLGQQGEGKIDAKIGLWLDRIDISQPPKNADAEYLRRWYLDVIGRVPTAEEMATALPKPGFQGPTADRIRAALDKPFTYEAKGRGPRIGEVILALKDAFEKDNPGLLINVNSFDKFRGDEDSPLPASRFDHVSFGAALEWIEDTLPGCRVVVRDYGIVLAPKDQLPPGAPLLHDFWKGADAGQPETRSGPPAVRFVSEVRALNKYGDGRVELLLRTYAGAKVAPGETLEVFRIHKENRRQDQYIGSIHVAGVGPAGATATPLDKIDVQPGDFAGVKIDGPDKNPTKPDAKDQPANLVKGEVKEVDKDGRIHINIGRKDGLAKGDSLTVYRQENPNGRALFLGRLRVIQVGDGEAIAQPIGDVKPAIQPGDHVLRDAPTEPNKVPINIEGKITTIRPDGQVVLNIGGDAGVRVGDQFEAYQPGKTPGTDVNIGPIRVTEVMPRQSVAKVIGAFMTAPQEGWRVVRIDHNN